MREHRALLLDAPLMSYEPQLLYTWAKASQDNECITVVYACEKCVKPDMTDIVYLVNGTETERIIAEIHGEYEVKTLNCFGEAVDKGMISANEIMLLHIPVGGMAVLNKKVM